MKIAWYHGLFAFLLFFIGVQFVGSMVMLTYMQVNNIPMIEMMNFSFSREGIVLQSTMMGLFLIGTPLVYILLLKKKPKEFFAFKSVNFKLVAISIVGMFAFGVLIDSLMQEITKIYPGFDRPLISLGMELNFHEMIAKVFEGVTLAQFLVLLFVIAILPGFGEEFLFRGFMQQIYSKHFSFFKSVLYSGGLFALIHTIQQLSQAAAAFIISFYLGWIFYKSNNLWIPILCHMFNNGLFCVLIYASNETSTGMIKETPPALILISIPLAFASLYLFNKEVNKETTPI